MDSNPNSQSVDILLVEDSPTDALMAQEAIECSQGAGHFHWVEDGVDAMAFLRREGEFRDAARPGLILLDLNLPRKSGREVLEEIKADTALRTIPVVVLSTSKADEDVARSYGLHANCYITKPVEFHRFAEVIRSVRDFWFSIVTLPPPAQ